MSQSARILDRMSHNRETGPMGGRGGWGGGGGGGGGRGLGITHTGYVIKLLWL